MGPLSYAAPTPRLVRSLARRWIPEARAAAWECGYALGEHGTKRRDIDLIAVPWIAHAAAPETLIRRICDRVGVVMVSGPTQKPCGRVAWSLHLLDNLHVYLDVSVMPPSR